MIVTGAAATAGRSTAGRRAGLAVTGRPMGGVNGVVMARLKAGRMKGRAHRIVRVGSSTDRTRANTDRTADRLTGISRFLILGLCAKRQIFKYNPALIDREVLL